MFRYIDISEARASDSTIAIKVSPFLQVAKYFGRSLRRNIIYQGVNLLKLRKVISVGADFNAPLRGERNEVTHKLIDLYAYNRVTRRFADTKLSYFFAFISPISSILRGIAKEVCSSLRHRIYDVSSNKNSIRHRLQFWNFQSYVYSKSPHMPYLKLPL